MTMMTLNRETQAVIDMAQDVYAEHTADGCCTATEPCEVVAYYQQKLAGFEAGRVERNERDAEPEKAGHRPAAGTVTRNQYGTSRVRYASPRQLGYVRHLLASKDTSALTERNAGIIAKAQAAVDANQISWTLASDALDILTTLADKPGAAPKANLASDKQKDLIRRLLAEKDLTGTAFPQWTDELIDTELTGGREGSASKAIDMLFGLPKKSAPAPAAQLESGIYAVGDRVFKVYWNQGKTRMLAKLLVLDPDGGEPTWDYQGMASRFVKPEQRMTLEQAKAFGAIYGVCCNCGRTLTDETSIEAGIGPVCAARFDQ